MGYVPPLLKFRDQLFPFTRQGGKLEHFYLAGYLSQWPHTPGDGTTDSCLANSVVEPKGLLLIPNG